MSRKMIDYKVENGKIVSIDGYEVGGGGGYKINKLTVTENGVYDSELEAYKPVVVDVPQISENGTLLKNLLDATKSTYYLFRDYKGTSVDGLISYMDTSNVTNMGSTFYNCSKLATIPQLYTPKVTAMRNMFQDCKNLTSVPMLDTSKVTDMSSMFNGCAKLTTIPKFDTSNVTNMSGMFSFCSNLTTVPELDASKVDWAYFGNTFSGCKKLTSIGLYGFVSPISIDSTALGHDALVAFLNQAGTATSGASITMGSAKLALLSDEEKAIATNKGWTLA